MKKIFVLLAFVVASVSAFGQSTTMLPVYVDSVWGANPYFLKVRSVGTVQGQSVNAITVGDTSYIQDGAKLVIVRVDSILSMNGTHCVFRGANAVVAPPMKQYGAVIAPGLSYCYSHNAPGDFASIIGLYFEGYGRKREYLQNLSGKVTADQINSDAITTNALQAGAVTGAKMAQDGAASGQVWKWNGTAWAPSADATGSTSPGGSTTQMQYNNTGAFDGQSNITTTEGATTGDELSIAGGSVTTGKALNVTANALTTGSVLNVSSTSTAAGSNTQTGLNVSLSGANSTSTQTTYGAQISNTHTGASSTNVGLNVDASGGTDNYSILLGANTAQNIYGARRTSDAGGSDLRIQAGGAFSGGTNRTGGNLLLSGGISTGSTGSEIQFLTATNIGSGTTDRNPTQKMVLNRSGFLGIGVTSPSYLLDGSGGVMRWNSAGTATSPNASSTACFQNNSSGFSYIEVKNASTSALFFGAISSGGAGRIGWHGTGGLNFNSAPVLNPGTVFDRFFIKDDGGQALQYLGGGTSAAGTATFISSGIFSATSTATVTNTTTEGTLLGAVSGTKTLPTNFFTAGKKVTVRVSGTVATDAVTPGTLNVQLKFGSTVIAQTTATTMLAVTGTRNWTADFEVVCRSTGASGTLQAGGNFEFYSAAGTKQFWECAQNLVSSFNTTSTHVVDVTATWGTADADNTISGTQAILIIED